MMMSKKYGKVPGKQEWMGFETDYAVRHAHKLLFGKSVSETVHLFGTCSIERAHELLFMPTKAFQYYVFAFAEYLMSAKAEGDADSASPFLRLLINREKRDKGSVRQILGKLQGVVDYVASHQEYYDADQDIYGDFVEFAQQIMRVGDC
ncbi:MAG: hypothetical protein ACRDD3_08710 [Azovibrio sp.]